MFRIVKLFTLIFSLFLAASAYSQNPQQEKKSPEQIAAEQADRLQRDLKLNDYQVFLADSVLQKNIAGVTAEFEKMQKAGMQNSDNYREVQLKWRRMTEDAFQKFMTPAQFEKYLKLSGVSSKERKKRLAK